MATLKTTIRFQKTLRTIVRGVGRPGPAGSGGGLEPIAANSLLGNPTGATANPVAMSAVQVSTLLNLSGTYLALAGGTLTGTLTGTTYRAHNAFTDEANRETALLQWSADVFLLRTEKAGTGVARRMELQTDGITRLRLDTDYQVRVGNQGTNAPSVFTFAVGATTSNGQGRGLSIFGRNNVTNGIHIGLVGDTFVSTSGTNILVLIGCTFSPTSGTATFTAERVAPTINQTGGANGITRGVSVEPTLTAAADWRSYDTNVNTGWAYHSSGTAPSRLGGSLTVIGNLTAPIGTTADLMIGTGASGILETKTPVQARSAIGVNTGTLQFDLFGDGAVLPVAMLQGQLRVPYNCTITSWELVSNETGSIQIDIEKDTYANFPPTSADSITGSSQPTITASNKAQSSTLTGWTTALNEGDYIKVEVLSVSAITQATLTLRVTRV